MDELREDLRDLYRNNSFFIMLVVAMGVSATIAVQYFPLDRGLKLTILIGVLASTLLALMETTLGVRDVLGLRDEFSRRFPFQHLKTKNVNWSRAMEILEEVLDQGGYHIYETISHPSWPLEYEKKILEYIEGLGHDTEYGLSRVVAFECSELPPRDQEFNPSAAPEEMRENFMLRDWFRGLMGLESSFERYDSWGELDAVYQEVWDESRWEELSSIVEAMQPFVGDNRPVSLHHLDDRPDMDILYVNQEHGKGELGLIGLTTERDGDRRSAGLYVDGGSFLNFLRHHFDGQREAAKQHENDGGECNVSY